MDGENNVFPFVNLGLPSGTLWAACNVGATSPEQAGIYFAWGETEGYTVEQVTSGVRAFDQENYKAAMISADLTPEQDAAHIHMGGNWKMPTEAEFQELIENCVICWKKNYNGTGVAGRVFKSKVNGNTVFFPAVGYCGNSSVYGCGSFGFYWSASWNFSSLAYELNFISGGQKLTFTYGRYCGYSVRGVCKR